MQQSGFMFCCQSMASKIVFVIGYEVTQIAIKMDNIFEFFCCHLLHILTTEKTPKLFLINIFYF